MQQLSVPSLFGAKAMARVFPPQTIQTLVCGGQRSTLSATHFETRSFTEPGAHGFKVGQEVSPRDLHLPASTFLVLESQVLDNMPDFGTWVLIPAQQDL